MALRRPITNALSCHNCQKWVLRSFIAGIGGPIAFQTAPLLSQRRPFLRTSLRSNEARERIQKEEKADEHPLNEINDAVDLLSDIESQAAPEKPPQEHVPWYLQVQQPGPRVESPLTARQKLPDLPDHPPPLLQPLLEHVSVELGMDDLSLLDLRSLDPPPALGANLLMIVGTARSEKHLHVSADRLCRWLRSSYKLRPYADGLLGRNELKLKLRRKAKRSRLLSAVGAKATAETAIDDGIRTGWVCVNVGRVQGGEIPNVQKSQRPEGFVGFGGTSDGSNVVVQLMTEDKRGEIDLENLWTGILNQTNGTKAKENVGNVDGHTEQAVEESLFGTAAESDSTRTSLAQNETATSATYYANTHFLDQEAGQQLRAYHTSTN